MYRTSTLKIIMLLSILTLTQITTLFATEIDHRKMRRDLDIAEEALKRILQYREEPNKEQNWLDTDQIQSAYIEGYGTIFLVKSSLRRRNFEINDQVNVHIKPDGTGNVTKKSPHSAIPSSKAIKQERLAEFLETYGSTIGQLKANERISIVLDTQFRQASITLKVKNFISKNMAQSQIQDSDTLMTEMGPLHTKTVKVNVLRPKNGKLSKVPGVKIRMVTPDSIAQIDTLSHQEVDTLTYKMLVSKNMKRPESATFSQREIIHTSIRKSDLEAFNKQSRNKDKLVERLTFQTLSADSISVKKIDILSGIFDTSLGLDTRSPLETQNQSLGAYIPNLGAFFFIKSNQQAMMHTDNPLTLTDILIETLADYGSTLRDLKSNEEVIVHVLADYPQYAFHHAFARAKVVKNGIYQVENFTKSIPNEFPGNLILRVQKKHLTNYTTGKINLEQLRNKITITDH